MEVPQRPHSLLHDHVAQGVAQSVILVMQHKRDTIPVRPIRLDLSPVGREEKRSCNLPEVRDISRVRIPCSAFQSNWEVWLGHLWCCCVTKTPSERRESSKIPPSFKPG